MYIENSWIEGLWNKVKNCRIISTDKVARYPTKENQKMTTSPYKGKTGLRRVWNAYHYSLAGLISAYKHESAFRQELMLGVPLVIIAIILPVSMLAKAFMISSVFLVLIVELLNSGIEAIVDRVSLEKHELSKRAKDIGSAAVFISLINCLLVWGLVLIDQLY